MQQKTNFRPNRFKKEEPYKVNELIQATTIRIVGDMIGESRIVTKEDGIRIARQHQLDLVEISPNATPPVCRVCDYQKFKYNLKVNKPKAKTIEVKEIRFGPNTGDHDFNFKMKHAMNFLQEGDKVKAVVIFSGREMAHKERGEELLLRLAVALESYGKVEQLPKLEGKRMFMMINSKAKKNIPQP